MEECVYCQIRTFELESHLKSCEVLKALNQENFESVKLYDWVGFDNKYGEMNCFLNSALQALWYVKSFRDSLINFPVNSDRISLASESKKLFKKYKRKLKTDERRVDITPLRAHLAHLYTNIGEFGISNQADAMEALGALLRGIHAYSVGDESEGVINSDVGKECQGCPVHQTLALDVKETHICECSHKTSIKWDVNSCFHLFCTQEILNEANSLDSSSEIRSNSMENQSSLMKVFDKLAFYMKREWRQTRMEKCDNDECTIKSTRKILKLLKVPIVYIVHLSWENKVQSPMETALVLSSIPFVLDLSSIYKGAPSTHHVLKGMIMFGMGHYVYCVRKGNNWYMLDDQTCKKFHDGSWFFLYKEMLTLYFQPVGLIYEISDEKITKDQGEMMELERHALEVSISAPIVKGRTSESREILEERMKKFHGSSIWLCDNLHLNDLTVYKCFQCGKLKPGENIWECKRCNGITTESSLYCQSCSEYRYTVGSVKRRNWTCFKCYKGQMSNTSYCKNCGKKPEDSRTCYNCSGLFKINREHCNDCKISMKCCLCRKKLLNKEPYYCPKCKALTQLSYCHTCYQFSPQPVCTGCRHKQFWECFNCNTANEDSRDMCKVCCTFKPDNSERLRNNFHCGRCRTKISIEQSKVCYVCLKVTNDWICYHCKKVIYEHNYGCQTCFSNRWSCRTCNTSLSGLCNICPTCF